MERVFDGLSDRQIVAMIGHGLDALSDDRLRLPTDAEQLTLLQEAVRLDPKDPQAHYALCVYNARAGDTQAANREFQALKQLDPKLAEKLADLLRPGAPVKKP